MSEAQGRALRVAAQALAERERVALEVQRRAPAFYAFAQECKRVFGPGTKVRYVKADDWEWGQPLTGWVVASASYEQQAGHKRKKGAR